MLSLEAVLQHVKDQWPGEEAASFDNWLKGEADYDIVLRGLRFLRHLEAHVECRPQGSVVYLHVGTAPTSRTRIWKLPKPQSTDLDKQTRSPLKAAELIPWNSLVEREDASRVLSDGLHRVVSLCSLAEALLSQHAA